VRKRLDAGGAIGENQRVEQARLERIYVSPVKSLALERRDRAYLDKSGIAGDRAFWLIDERGKLVTQREVASLARVQAAYDLAADRLVLTLPGGDAVGGAIETGDAISTRFFGEREVEGALVLGPWSDALSAHAGQPLRLVKALRPGQTFDGYPLSMCSVESIAALARAAGVAEVDGRRFRQSLWISGVAPHGEDEWLGREVRVGNAIIRMKMRDSRCVVTTRDPETGEDDLDTLKIIAGYRTDQPKEVNFGVYATVVRPGSAEVGDVVEPIAAAVK
jgi:uncharacterized protein YcbX